MLKISEEYLHFAWKFGLFYKENITCHNERLTISDPGEHNHSSGPDFFNARIKIGDTIWAGNVEIHLKASDWYRHEHHTDPVYDSVILHVIHDHDCDIFRINGEKIPVFQIRLIHEYLEQYHKLILNKSVIHCFEKLGSIDKIYFRDWITRMMISRLQEKTEMVLKVLKDNKFDWEETFYRFLGKGFGFNLNKIPFNLLTETVPMKVLLKHRNNPDTINAILFGQAGFLEDAISGDAYYDFLRKEYQSIRRILPARVLHSYSWQFMRLRPANFPTVRISQFASLIIRRFPMFADIIECKNVAQLQEIFRLSTGKYWIDHRLFGRSNGKKNYHMGIESAKLIIINSIIPVLFTYGKFRVREELRDRALRFLEELPAEENEIINRWKKAGIRPENAFDTQGLLQLTNNYCRQLKCLQCLVGSKLVVELK